MDRGRGRYPRRAGGSGRPWVGGKRNAPDEWMEEDDLMMEDGLREKLHREQEQKRRIQEKQSGFPQNSSIHHGSQISNRSRFESRSFGGASRGDFTQSKGWQVESRHEGKGREGVSQHEDPPRGDSRGGLGGRGGISRFDRSRLSDPWANSRGDGKGEEMKKAWGRYWATHRGA